MRSKLAFAALALPLALGSYIAFHPGVAFAEPAYSRAASSFQGSASYTVDPAHTSIGFEVNHLGLSNVQGRFTKKAGKLLVDAKDLTRSSVEFTIDTSSIDTAVEARDNHLRSADFFDAAKYPQMTFKSTGIRKSGRGYAADGLLTIKAVTKKVSLSFRHYGPMVDPQGKTRIGVVVEPFKINRQDYGIAYNAKLANGTPSVGDEVTVRVALEAIQDK